MEDYSVSDRLARADGRQERWAAFEDAAEAQGFTMISNAVLRDPKVGMAAKTLYALLKSYAWQDPFCYPGQQRLADDLGVHRNTVGKLVKELDAAGLIHTKRRGLNRSNLYTFLRVRPMSTPDAHQSVQPDAQQGVRLDATATMQDEDAGNEHAENEEPTVVPSGTTVGSDREIAVSALPLKGNKGRTSGTFRPEIEEAMRVIYARLKAAGIEKVPRWRYAAMKCDLDRREYTAEDPEWLAEALIEHYEETGEVDHELAWVHAERRAVEGF